MAKPMTTQQRQAEFNRENVLYNIEVIGLNAIPFGDDRRREKWGEIQRCLARLQDLIPTKPDPMARVTMDEGDAPAR